MKYYLPILLLILISCSKEKESIKPIISNITESVYASGKIEAREQYQVFATVSGIVENIIKVEGDSINAGEVFISIKNDAQNFNKENAILSREFSDRKLNQSKLDEAKSKVNLAESVLENDSLLYEKQKNLWTKSVGSKNDLDRAELKYKSSKSAYISAKEMYDQVKRQVNFSAKQSINNLKISDALFDDFSIKSLVNGEIYEIYVEKGDLVTPQKPLAVIGKRNDFILKMDIDEKDIKDIRIGQEVIIELNSYLDSIFTAKVSKINPLMNEQTKTFQVEAEFVKRPNVLYPNSSFEANIVINSKKNTLVIPLEYLNNNSVTLKDGSSKKVTPGLKDYKKVEILSGIDKNTEIIKP